MPTARKPAVRTRRPRRLPQEGFTLFLLDLDSYEGLAFYAKEEDTPEDAQEAAQEWAERELSDGWIAAAMVEGKTGNPKPGSTGFTVFLANLDSDDGIAYYAKTASTEANAKRLANGWAARAIRDGYSVVGTLRGEVTPVHEDGGGVYCRLVNFRA
jgi:hypothetical protein